MTEAKYKSNFEHIKDTPYLTLMGELWGVFCENFGENQTHYNRSKLYVYILESSQSITEVK